MPQHGIAVGAESRPDRLADHLRHHAVADEAIAAGLLHDVLHATVHEVPAGRIGGGDSLLVQPVELEVADGPEHHVGGGEGDPQGPALLGGDVDLDFDGEEGPHSGWGNFDAASYNFDNAEITEIWERVAEDFAPFNLNVTTDLQVYRNAPESSRQRCIITPTNNASPPAVTFSSPYRARLYRSAVPS